MGYQQHQRYIGRGALWILAGEGGALLELQGNLVHQLGRATAGDVGDVIEEVVFGFGQRHQARHLGRGAGIAEGDLVQWQALAVLQAEHFTHVGTGAQALDREAALGVFFEYPGLLAVRAIGGRQAGDFPEFFFKGFVAHLCGFNTAAQSLEDLGLGFCRVKGGKWHFIGLEQGVLFACNIARLEPATGEHAVEQGLGRGFGALQGAGMDQQLAGVRAAFGDQPGSAQHLAPVAAHFHGAGVAVTGQVAQGHQPGRPLALGDAGEQFFIGLGRRADSVAADLYHFIQDVAVTGWRLGKGWRAEHAGQQQAGIERGLHGFSF